MYHVYSPIENRIIAMTTAAIGISTVIAPNAGYASLCVSPEIYLIVGTA